MGTCPKDTPSGDSSAGLCFPDLGTEIPQGSVRPGPGPPTGSESAVGRGGGGSWGEGTRDCFCDRSPGDVAGAWAKVPASAGFWPMRGVWGSGAFATPPGALSVTFLCDVVVMSPGTGHATHRARALAHGEGIADAGRGPGRRARGSALGPPRAVSAWPSPGLPVSGRPPRPHLPPRAPARAAPPAPLRAHVAPALPRARSVSHAGSRPTRHPHGPLLHSSRDSAPALSA